MIKNYFEGMNDTKITLFEGMNDKKLLYLKGWIMQSS